MMRRLVAMMVVAGCGGAHKSTAAQPSMTQVANPPMVQTAPAAKPPETPVTPVEDKPAGLQVAAADPCDGGQVKSGVSADLQGPPGSGGPPESGGGSIGTIGTGAGGLSIGKGYGIGNRKQKVPTITFGRATVNGKLRAEIVARIVKSHAAQLQYCYEKRLVAKPTLRGLLVATFVITASGTVIDATASGVDKEVEQCIVSALPSWAFPRPTDGVVKVTQPITFSVR